MENCTSGYEPSSIVETFHNIPHVDIDLGEINSTYEQTVEEYFEAIIVWSCLPVLFGVIMIILFFLFWGLLWCYEYCTRTDSPMMYQEPSMCTKVLVISLLLFSILLGIGICGATFYVEVELNREIIEIADTASTTEDTIDSIGTLANSYDYMGVKDVVAELRVYLNDTSVPLLNQLNATALSLFYMYGNISTIAQGYFLDESADDVENFEATRHWTVMAFLILVVLLFIFFFVILILRTPYWITAVAVLVFIFMMLMWCASGAALGAVIVSSDICFNPDETILTQISSANNREITEYYMVCNETCNSDNTFVESVERLQEAQELVEEQYNALDESIISNETIQAVLDNLFMLLDNSSARRLDELTDCTSLSQGYSETRDNFCDEGIIYTLVLFCVASALAFLYFIILCLTKKYLNVLYAAERWNKTGFSYQFSPTPEVQSNGYTNGSSDAHRQTSVRRKQQYDGGWVAGKTHEGNYKHRGSSAEYELQEGPVPEYTDVLNH